ncbi:unnamed protein product [Owenia fusiformis]|uniref:Metalloendopeptidase n=1 Tax=Owenia fusiformis TaxID=6347 RepID=A0A8J1XZX8_OWEFU|nr:unnamed protein product [Owenia fusiformis]
MKNKLLFLAYFIGLLLISNSKTIEDDNEIEKEPSESKLGEGPEDGYQEVEDNPEENGDLSEGDIDRSEEKFKSARTGDSALRWPRGKVIYAIDKMKISSRTSANITKAMKMIEDAVAIRGKKCIEFSPKSYSDDDFVFLTSKNGCFSKVGKVGGRQDISLGIGCRKIGTIIHELLHSLGLEHAHTEANRDNYVHVNWKNVIPGKIINFKKRALSKYDHKPYDVGSIMHYGNFVFSKRPYLKTMQSKKNPKLIFGQRSHLSKGDIAVLRKMYMCTAKGSGVKSNTVKKSYAQPKPKTTKKAPLRQQSTRRNYGSSSVRRTSATTRRRFVAG